MPVENERKYVLAPPWINIERDAEALADDVLQIDQGYLLREKNVSLRIRNIFQTKPITPTRWWEFNMKRTINGETIEIESFIDEKDFNKLWSVCAGKLRKFRYVIEGWEIDFFKDKQGKNYFVQAEKELAPGVEKPYTLLPLVEENLLYAVVRGDNRFSSKKLSDVSYSTKVLNALLLNKGKVK